MLAQGSVTTGSRSLGGIEKVWVTEAWGSGSEGSVGPADVQDRLPGGMGHG